MKSTLYSLIAIVMFGINTHAQTTLMTYNIRFDNPNDKDNWWEHRKAELTQLLNYYHPDIFGVQEALKRQLDFMDDELPDYQYIGVGRDDGKEKGEYAAIFYNAEKLELISSHTYWLSETPDKVSVGWDASMERITTYGVFRDKASGDTLHVFNCHYDHIGKVARKNSSELILKLIEQKQLYSKNLVVMGDLNSEPENPPITTLSSKLQDSYIKSKIAPYGPVGTFNGFDHTMIPERRIDYIFVKNLEVQSYRVINDKRANGLSPSDHLPVFVEVAVRN